MSGGVCLRLVLFAAVAHLILSSAWGQDEANPKLSPAELFRRNSPAIVRVYRYDEQGIQNGQGTGFFITDDGLLVTNHHVVDGGTSWQVVFGDERSFEVDGILVSSARADLAILQVSGRWFQHLTLSTGDLPGPGEKVLAIGNPLGLTNTISDGLLSGYRDNPGRPRMLQISAPISQGSSGGPLFVDGDPRVVGVTTSVASGGQNLNFAVPSREIEKLLRDSSRRLIPKDPSAAKELFAAAKSGSFEQLNAILQGQARHDQLASTTVFGDEELRYFHWQLAPNLLTSGRNVLAVELHQRGSISSDLGFDLALTANRDARRVLVPQGATWKYLDDGSDQGHQWRDPRFDDSQWKSGPAKLGYGDDNVATVVSYGENENNKHITTYFRQSFDVHDAASVDQLTLSLLRDDGALIYLNGKLAVVDNMDIGIDINSQDSQRRTALHLAAEAGDERAARLLLKAGVMPNRQTSSGKTALDVAVDNQHDTVAKAIRDGGGLSSTELTRVEELLASAQRGKLNLVQAVVGEGLDINSGNGDGATALHYAVYAGQAMLAQWLMDHGADVNHADVNGYRPLHVAVLHGRSELGRALIENGADVNARRLDGSTCLLDASQIGNRDVVAMLLERGADVEVRAKSTGRTAIYNALLHEDVLSLLLEKGADANADDRSGLTPLLLATRRGLNDAVEMLRQHNAKATIASALPTSLRRFSADMTNSIGMAFKRIEPGQFTMGSPKSEKGRSQDERQHSVTLTKEFLIGVTEVTREQFELFTTETGYQPFTKQERQTVRLSDGRRLTRNYDLSWRVPNIAQGTDHPAVLVSWNDAVEFCQWLSRREESTYRLPTEAEWEYACRAGTTDAFFTGQEIDELKKAAWFNPKPAWFSFGRGQSNEGTQAVASYAPNAWGLYDMHGNVREWTADRFGDYSIEAATDPQGPEQGNRRAHRGGAWNERASRCRSADRQSADPETGYPNVGFRVVLESN